MTDYTQLVRARIDSALRLAAPRLYTRDRRHIVDALMLTILNNGNEIWHAAKEARDVPEAEQVPGQTAFDMTPSSAPRHLRAIPGGGGSK